MIKKYKQFLVENLEEGSTSDVSDYQDMKDDLKEKIESSVNSSDPQVVKEFVSAYLEDQDESQIEGLINSSDVYEFYLKYTADIDEILVELDFFSQSPESVDKLSLFDYLVYGTQQAVKTVVEKLNSDIYGTEEGQEF